MGPGGEWGIRRAWFVSNFAPFYLIFAHFYRYVDTEAANKTADPLAALEKTTSAQTNLTQVQIPRLESLQSVSDRFNADPYALSSKLRRGFREEKKVATAKRKVDDDIKERYALPSALPLLEDDAETAREAKEQWERAREQQVVKRRKVVPASVPLIPKASSAKTQTAAISALRARVLGNTAKSVLNSKPTR